ncbi:EAL domain-containing protein [Roseisolibacter agri]|uniref:GGDEF domain-containing protein n=1 Tax=Roseisolibacter agri TaxID=2014610 RepID=A0AA37Q833_9BACT|nr:EAL domain-containing protein [Roseisolibacter agri]GLC24066.1 GGDEF domain-containing protein [Roseisolibacter agri]
MVARLPALTRRSFAVVAAVALLVLAGQAAAQWAHARQAASNRGVDELARHRLLSGRLVRASLVASRDDLPPAVAEAARRELVATELALDSLHHARRDAIDSHEAPLVAACERLRQAAAIVAAPALPVAERAAALPVMLDAEREVVHLVTAEQRTLADHADARMATLRRLEIAFTVLVLATLVVGGFVVVRPATRASERLMGALLASRVRLQAAHADVMREREFATSLVHSASDAMFAFDGALRITAWNPAMERWTGLARDAALGRRPEDIEAELDWGAAGRPYARALAGETVQVHERPGRASAASPIHYFDASCVPLCGADGRITGGLVSVRDVTARVLAAEQVRRSEARFHALFDQAPLGIVLLDDAGTVVDANPAFGRLVGRSPAELRGSAGGDLVSDEDRAAVREPLRELREGRRASVTVEQRFVRPDGESVWASLTVRRVDVLGAGATLMGMAQDVTSRRELEARLSHQAFHDPLTGLANRSRLRERLDAALAAPGRRADGVALVYVDLDDFKKVNDSLGHAAGDQLLRVVAERLLSATRGSDTVARLGGDEFAILLDNVRVDQDVLVVAERVGKAMRAPFQLEGKEVFVGASVGIARGSADAEHAAGADELLRNADVAMYVAKRGGKGRHAIYAREMNADALDRLELEADMRHALDRDELLLHYQPIVDLTDGRVLGVEALVRWHHPRRGLLLPGAFVPLAEETGLITPIGRWVLAEACRQGVAWMQRRAGTAPLTLSVNVSPRQLQHGAIVEDVASALRTTGFPPALLLLELTEGIFMHSDDSTLEVLQALKALGVRLGIDDFGTGYASLRYLQRFPVDVLKIDKTFVDGLALAEEQGDSGEVALARAIVALGDTLSLRTMAEGVEATPQWEQLRRLGCTIGQGHLFGRALPPDEVAAFLELDAEPRLRLLPASAVGNAA